MKFTRGTCISLQAVSFKRPLLSVCIDVYMYVCLSATFRSNIWETKGDRGLVTTDKTTVNALNCWDHITDR